ncbi:MAG: hypothetical protein ACE5RG_04215 [Candidatus Nitrosomaritimum yanchengensis]
MIFQIIVKRIQYSRSAKILSDLKSKVFRPGTYCHSASQKADLVKETNLSAGLVPILSDLYQYQKQKIEMLEDFLKSEKIENIYEN